MTRAALYVRVSTKEQTTENQKIELERVARTKGWTLVALYEDEGISGSKGRHERPAFDRALKDVLRAKFDVFMAWDVSRLGRSLTGLVQTLDELHSNGVHLYLHQQAIDTTTPSGKAMFQMCGVFAEFERSMMKERVRIGLSRAREMGKTLGRPRLVVDGLKLANDRANGMSFRTIAAKYGMSVGKVHALLRSPP